MVPGGARFSGCRALRRKAGRPKAYTLGALAGLLVLCLVTASCASARAFNESGDPDTTTLLTSSSSTSSFRIGTTQWPGEISYNPYNPDVVQYYNFSLVGLAYLSYIPRPGSNPYLPELATGWSTTKSTITIHLRTGAKWQDGQLITSQDLLTSLLLAGADYNNAWGAISGVRLLGTHTVKISLYKWASAANELPKILQISILPKSQYGSLIPKGFKDDLVAYWKQYDPLHPTVTSVAAAGNSEAGKVVAHVDKALAAFSPSKLIGDGPYGLVTANSSGVLYRKWSGWWDARVIRIPSVEIFPMDGATQYGSLLSGKIDEEYGAILTDPQVTKLRRSEGHYYVIPEPVQEFSLMFHFKDYPFDLRPVRQAIAYIVNRVKFQRLLLSGRFLQNSPPVYPDGISYTIGDRYITKSQLDSLNSYGYSPKRASALLNAAGFHKKAGEWYTPKGTPFTITVYSVSGNPIFEEGAVIVSGMLSQFGIKASADLISSTAYTADQLAGDYAVSLQNIDSGFVNPISYFAAGFVGAYNYPVTYSGTGVCAGCRVAIGIGPLSHVPGLGRVNIAAALNSEELSAPPGKWSNYVWDWARWINENLPFIPIQDTDLHAIFSTKRFTDFAPSKERWLWASWIGGEQIVAQMQEGYVHFRR